MTQMARIQEIANNSLRGHTHPLGEEEHCGKWLPIRVYPRNPRFQSRYPQFHFRF